MRNLLRADFARLLRDRAFWLCCAVLFAAGAALPVIHYIDNRNAGAFWAPDDTCFTFAFLLPILLSLLAAFFVGCDYSDGTVRNKLIVGHRRSHIYLSDLAVTCVAGMALSIAYSLPHTCLSLALLGKFRAPVQALLPFAVLSLTLTAAFSALYVLIALLCRGKAQAVAGCLLLVFALLFAGVRLTSALNEPEYYAGYSYTENGVTTVEDEEPNPNYVGGKKRQVYEFLNEFTPGGQVLKLSGMTAEKPWKLVFYDGLVLLVSTGVGLAAFRRKDLK